MSCAVIAFAVLIRLLASPRHASIAQMPSLPGDDAAFDRLGPCPMPPVPLGVRARVQAVNLGIGAIQRSGPCLSHNPQQRPEGEGGRVRTLAAVAAMPLVVRVVRRTPYGTGRMLHDQLWHRSQRGPAVRGMGCMLCDGVRSMLRTTCHVARRAAVQLLQLRRQLPRGVAQERRARMRRPLAGFVHGTAYPRPVLVFPRRV